MSKLHHLACNLEYKSLEIFTTTEMGFNVNHTICQISKLFITYEFNGPQGTCIPTQFNVTIPLVWPTLVDCYITNVVYYTKLYDILNLGNQVLN